MRIIDCHIHYPGDCAEIKDIVDNSKYKDIYLGYSSINYNKLDISEHLNQCDGGFIMPYCFKETNINTANEELYQFMETKRDNKFYFLPFISTVIDDRLDMDRIIGMKEHFYIHDSFKYHERIGAYQYLNDHKKMLIIHCDNSIRINYVKYLNNKFPNMIIQVAHMGVFRNSNAASRLVIDELSSLRNIYFDISTVFDENLIQYSIMKIPNQVLFGTDVPYVQDDRYLQKYYDVLERCDLPEELIKRIYFKNAEELIKTLN